MAFIYSPECEYSYICIVENVAVWFWVSAPDHAGRNSAVFCSKIQTSLNLKTQVKPKVSDEELWICITSVFRNP